MSINFKKFFCQWFGIGCPSPAPVPPPPPTPQFKAIAIIVKDQNGTPVPGVSVALDGNPNPFLLTNQDGYALQNNVPYSLTASQLTASATGYLPLSIHVDLPLHNQDVPVTIQAARPVAVAHHPIAPPFDQTDSGGIVHTDLPPEQVIPAHFSDPAFLRADFNGVTLDLNRWNPKAPSPLPLLQGANSTPLQMIMTPMLIMYPKYWQDAVLTEHAERGYDDLIIDCEPWNASQNGQSFSPAQILDWLKYVKSWGFRPVIWRGDPTKGVDTMFQTLIDSGLVSFYIHGEEVDSRMTSEAYEASLQQIDSYIKGRLPIGAHFTADGQRHMGYPIGMPRDTFLNDWSPYDGRVHLMWQGDQSASAGLMGAALYYARLHVNAGIGDAARGPGAPHSRIIAFELRATDQFYGKLTEEQGNLCSWEMLCTTRNNPKILPVSGFGNGCRYPNGQPL